MKPNRLRLTIAALAGLNVLALAFPVHADLVVDRGLPTGSEINDPGASRSNISWADILPYFSGDDFSIAAPAQANHQWQINSVKTWAVSIGTAPQTAAQFQAEFSDISLFMSDGTIGGLGTLSLISTTPTITPVTYSGGGPDYDDGGFSYQVFEIEFANLDISYDLGAAVDIRFGVYMEGIDPDDLVTPISGFNHASNAALSNSPQQGSDDRFHWFERQGGIAVGAPAPYGLFYDSAGAFPLWDKSSDINVQVNATLVPETTTYVGWAMMALVVGGASYLRRRGSRA